MSIVKLENISFGFDNKSFINDFDLEINSKTTCLLGSSGCGKTTILRLIAGLETPRNGRITIGKKTVFEKNRIIVSPQKREIGFVFQDLALWPHFTVYKSLEFVLSNKKNNINSDINKTLEFFNLINEKNKYPHQLSGGQKQLLAIARAIITKPKLLLMDEPLANLDVKLKSKIISYIKDIKKSFDTNIIYVTHDHKEAFEIAEEIVVLNNGKIEFQGSIADVRNTGNEFVKYFIEF